MKFTEAQLEQAFIELLQAQDVTHVPGNILVRESDEVILKEDLKLKLQQEQNK